MEEIAKKKVDALRVYCFLQRIESDLALQGIISAMAGCLMAHMDMHQRSL